MTDTDPHGRKSNNPVWEGDVHADCRALEIVLAVELAAARTVVQRLVETDASFAAHTQVCDESPCARCTMHAEVQTEAFKRASDWLAGSTEPTGDRHG